MSRRASGLVLLCAAALIAACATTTADDEIRKLEGRASYEAGVRSISEGRISLGLSSLRQAVEIEPRNPLYHNAVGAVLLNIGRYADAQVEFQKAVELDPTYADAFHNLGSAYAEQAKWEDAIGAYRRALAQTIYTRPETTYNNLGYAYWALDRARTPRSVPVALQLEPKLVPSHFWLGCCSRRKAAGGGQGPLPGGPGPRPASMLGRRADEVLKAMGDGG